MDFSSASVTCLSFRWWFDVFVVGRFVFLVCESVNIVVWQSVGAGEIGLITKCGFERFSVTNHIFKTFELIGLGKYFSLKSVIIESTYKLIGYVD